MKCPKNVNQSSAFTLLELLVVIAVVAILVALALPAINKVRAKAVLGKDISNLRQIGQAIQLYTADKKGFYPTIHSGAGQGWQPPYWTDQVDDYLSGKKKKGKLNKVFFTDSVEDNHAIGGYGANPFVISLIQSPANQNESGIPTSVSSLSVTELSKTILVSNSYKDVGNEELRAVFTVDVGVISNNPEAEGRARPYPLHPDNCFAAVFCDGHTEVIPFEKYVEDPKALYGERPWE